jgi:hypothetical protein
MLFTHPSGRSATRFGPQITWDGRSVLKLVRRMYFVVVVVELEVIRLEHEADHSSASRTEA